jgi:hypothetical protein
MGPPKSRLETFDMAQMEIVDGAVALAEEVTSNYYKYSASQWRRSRYDIQTLKDLRGPEITNQAFAQILRYIGHPSGSTLGSSRFDFYKVCLQDHVILQALKRDPTLALFALMVYVVTHELVHIVRFSRFLQSFEAYPTARMEEESRVHTLTADILRAARVSGMESVVEGYQQAPEMEEVLLDRVVEGV